jgi:hypothetical protein
MFKGKKTTTFWLGLIAIGFALNSLFSLLYQLVSILIAGRTYTLSISYIPQISFVMIFLVFGLYVMSKGIEKQPSSMSEGRKTTTFYVGLLALGFAIYDFCFLVYFLLSNRLFASYISPISSIPYVASVVIFLVIGLFVMRKGIEKQSVSNV